MYYDLKDVDEVELAPGFYGKIIHSKTMSVAHVRVEAGAELPEHKHINEQIMNLIEGEFLFTVDGKEYRMKAGESFVISSNIPHSAKAVTACKIVDLFYPVREDWK